MRYLPFWVLMALLLSGCVQDTCTTEQQYVLYEAVYMTTEELRSEIRPEEPRDLEQPGKIYSYQQYLFINEPNVGIHILDNTDPTNPQAVSFLNIPGNIDLAVQNNLLYADNYVDLVVFDLSNPARPRMVGRSESVFPAMGEDPEAGIVVELRETEVVESYPCSEGLGQWFWRDGWLYVDNSFDLVSEAAFGAPLPNLVGVGGSLARFTIGFNRLYTVSEYDLKVFSLDAPVEPELIHIEPIGWGIETIFPYGDHLFIGSRTGMHIMDASNPDAPRYVSTFWHTNACDPVFIDGDIAYVTLRDGTECETFANQLDVVDISDLFNPQLLRTYPMHRPIGLSVRQEHLYLCDDTEGLKVFDASDPILVGERLLRQLDDINAIDIIALPGRPVIMVIGRDGLYQYDIRQPDDPQLLSFIPALDA